MSKEWKTVQPEVSGPAEAWPAASAAASASNTARSPSLRVVSAMVGGIRRIG